MCWKGNTSQKSPTEPRPVTEHKCGEGTRMACCGGCSGRFTTNRSTPLTQKPRTNSHRVAGFLLKGGRDEGPAAAMAAVGAGDNQHDARRGDLCGRHVYRRRHR